MVDCTHTFENNEHVVVFDNNITLRYTKDLDLIESADNKQQVAFELYEGRALLKILSFILSLDEIPLTETQIKKLLNSKGVQLRGYETRSELIYIVNKNLEIGLIKQEEIKGL